MYEKKMIVNIWRALKKCLSSPFNNSSLHIVTILYGYVRIFL